MKMFKKNYSTDVVKEVVKCTYYTQRKDINKGARNYARNGPFSSVKLVCQHISKS